MLLEPPWKAVIDSYRLEAFARVRAALSPLSSLIVATCRWRHHGQLL